MTVYIKKKKEFFLGGGIVANSSGFNLILNEKSEEIQKSHEKGRKQMSACSGTFK